jgi:hypothetical protein
MYFSDRLDKVTPAQRAGVEPPHFGEETGPYLGAASPCSAGGPYLCKYHYLGVGLAAHHYIESTSSFLLLFL